MAKILLLMTMRIYLAVMKGVLDRKLHIIVAANGKEGLAQARKEKRI